MEFTEIDLEYLTLGGINHDGFTEDEKRDYLYSLCEEEKTELNKYVGVLQVEDEVEKV